MNILMPICSCDPEGESESLVGYNWLSQVARKHWVFLITARKYRQSLEGRMGKNIVPYYVDVPEFGNREVLSGLAPGYFVFLWRAYFVAKRIIKAHRIDLIHRITPIAFRFPDVFTGLGIPCLIGPVGGGLKPLVQFPSVFKKEHAIHWLRNLDRLRFYCDPFLIRTYKKAKKILIIGKYLHGVIPERYHSKLQVFCEAAIDTRLYDFRLERKNSTLRILCVGRFIPLKGINLLIKALHLLKKEHEDVKFSATLIGDGGEYFEYCKCLASHLALSGQINFAGRMKRTDIIRYYQEFDVFCFPSLKESSGNVLLEAMSCGIPVIVAERGGPAEIVADDCGIKVPVRNEKDFVARLKDAIVRLTDPRLRHEYAINARRRVEEQFDVNTISARISAVYGEILR